MTPLIHFVGATGNEAVHVHGAVAYHTLLEAATFLDLTARHIRCTTDQVVTTSYRIIAPLVNRVTMIGR
jgi:hypothetical protein